MPLNADCHLHSSFSGDSQAPMEDMVLQGISRGLSVMCFTEHHDIDFPDSPDGPGNSFLLDAGRYRQELVRLREKYRDRIRLLFGVELGLQPAVNRENTLLAGSFDFDYIIGSTHICHGKDPYCPDFYQGRSEEDAYREYFEAVLENVSSFSDFDSCGHLDYAIRYGPNKDTYYSYERYGDILDEILKCLIQKEKGLELNTGGLKAGMRDFHPCRDALRRYRSLGGELITIGSDSHDPGSIARDFDLAAQALKECGFKYYAVYEKRSPVFFLIE